MQSEGLTWNQRVRARSDAPLSSRYSATAQRPQSAASSSSMFSSVSRADAFTSAGVSFSSVCAARERERERGRERKRER